MPVIGGSLVRWTHISPTNRSLGRRPGAGDPGLFGQLSQLVGFDPTSREIAHAVAPRTVSWVDRMPDGSGLMPEDTDWVAIEDQPASLGGLLEKSGGSIRRRNSRTRKR